MHQNAMDVNNLSGLINSWTAMCRILHKNAYLFIVGMMWILFKKKKFNCDKFVMNIIKSTI